MPILRETEAGIVISVVASAGSSQSRVKGIHGDALKVAVRSAPENGKANAEIEGVLADFFAVAKNRVRIVSGQTSRQKRVEITGISAGAAEAVIHSKLGAKQ